MAKKDIGKNFMNSVHSAVDSAKSSVQNVKIPEIKKTEVKVPDQFKELFKKGREKDIATDTSEHWGRENISIRNAIKIIYYMMAVDGEIFHCEEEKFDLIGRELDINFNENKEMLIKECRAQMDKVIDAEDYYDVIQEGVEDALSASKQQGSDFIDSKLLVWDLLTVAYSEENYNESERKLLKYIVRKLKIDKALFLEMESSICTLIELERELSWIKTTDRPYLTIESMVKEITNRKNVIFDSVKELISL